MINYKQKSKNEKEVDLIYNEYRDEKTLIEQKRAWILGIGVFCVVLGIISISAYLRFDNLNSLEKNGVETIAIVKDIRRNSYHTNDLEWIVVNNHVISYEFEVSGEIMVGIQTIENEDYHRYFVKTIGREDSIRVVYNINNPSMNRIIKN